MGLITFNIENNYITCDTTYIISDNTNYKAKAVFDKEWDGNAYITWLFVYEDKTFKQYICSKTDTISIPKINGTPYIYIGCVSGDQRTTNHVALRVIQSVTELADEERPEIDSDAYDELMDILDEHDGRLDALESTITDKYTKAQTDTLLNGKVDKVTGKGLSTNDYTTTDKSKVDAIPSNPKYTDTVYDDTAIKQQINGKVDKVTGKGLSTNDYTNSDKSKVSNIPDNPKYTDTVYDDTDIKNDLEELESEVDGKASAESVQNLNSSKLSKPTSGIAVGKYFRVASIDSEGNPVLEACDLPKGTAYTVGVLRGDQGTGVDVGSAGNIRGLVKTANQYTSLNNTYLVCKGILDNVLATPSIMPTLTASEQIAARQRMGLDKEWVLKGEIVGDETDRGNIDTGVTVDLTGCTELVINGNAIATGNVSIYSNIGVIVYYGFATSRKRLYAMWRDSCLGFDNFVCKISSSSDALKVADPASGYSYTSGDKIHNINKIMFPRTMCSLVTSCNIQIYAR